VTSLLRRYVWRCNRLRLGQIISLHCLQQPPRRSYRGMNSLPDSPISPNPATLTGMRRLLPVLMGFALLLLSSTEGWSLPPCPGSPLTGSISDVGSWSDCFGIRTISSGDWAGYKYVGEFRNGKRNGQGTQTFSAPHKLAGQKYVGEFRDGKVNGQGTATFSAPHKGAVQKYVGEFRNQKKHGQGTLTFSAPHKLAGEKYVGEWKDGSQHGQGTSTWSAPNKNAGEKYVGEFRNGKRHGQGIGTFADGRVQEGIWENDRFQYAQKVTPTVTARKSAPPNTRRPSTRKRSDPNKIVSASSGTGFAVSSNGHVITNHHVIEGCQKVRIHHKGKSIPATVVTFDPRNDLALLKGDFRPSTVFSLSNASPELLQDVYVAGFPFGRKVSTSVKVTKGIISSLTGIGNNFSNIQIDAALQSGNSGGPILDEKGNVVGVAVARLDKMYALKNFGSLPENTNFGIKTSVVRSILESSNVSLPSPNRSKISKSKLGKMISDATYYLSCWMTMAQIEKMRSKKVIFQNLD